MAHLFGSCKNVARLCQVWGQGEHMCNNEKSPNTSLSPFCLNSKAIQMNPKPFGNLSPHMNLQHLAPCQVWKTNDKEKLHDDYKNYSWVVTTLPYQHWISSRDLSM